MQCTNGAATETGTCFTIRYKTTQGEWSVLPHPSLHGDLPANSWSVCLEWTSRLVSPSTTIVFSLYSSFVTKSHYFPNLLLLHLVFLLSLSTVTPSPSENLTLSSSLLPFCLTSDVSKSCYSVHFVKLRNNFVRLLKIRQIITAPSIVYWS